MSIVASDQTHRIRMAFANGSCKLSVQTPTWARRRRS